MASTIACVGAHALDAEVMGGGVAASLAARGWSALMVHMTRGERGHPRKAPEVFGKQLEEEMQRAAACLSAEAVWMGFPAGDLPAGADEALARLFSKREVDVVITHHSGSYHPRHVRTARAVLSAVRLCARQGRRIGLYLGENMEDPDGFVPTVYFDIGDSYAAWQRALECYELYRGGVNRFPYRDYYTSTSIARGIEAGVSHAQALMLPKIATSELWGGFSLCSPAY